jgi:hypothetical protein
LEIPTKESAKAVELDTTGASHSAEQDGTIHVSQTTQKAPDGVRVLPPTEDVQRVVSKQDTSSEMMAAASGPRPVEAQASSAVNHRGVASLSPVTPKSRQRIWAAGTPNSNLGDPTPSIEPETMAVRTGVPDTPSDIAIRDEQLSLMKAAMEESQKREERMTLMLYEMQQKLNATETQQELFSQKVQKDQQDLLQAY